MPMTIRRALRFDRADANSMKLVLFSDIDRVPRGWYIGPLVKVNREFVLPFLPFERNALAVVAIAQVFRIATEAKLPVTIVDPEHLWDEVWPREEPPA